jgi:AcrR family transcriptional regulator
MVQHYFRTKDEMMIFVLDVVSQRVQARLALHAQSLGDDPAPRALVRALMIQVLPLDEERATEGRVALAFLAYAAVRPQARGFARAPAAADLPRRPDPGGADSR